MSVAELLPPEDKIFVGEGDFLRLGNEFLRYFIDLGGLKPHHRVLDVGCGIGRMAIPLTQYLDATGRYEGFDIVGMGIDWCREKITPRYPNFHFQRADIYNKSYNPTGRCQPWAYRFPYRSNTFDFVFLTSVFTHMLPREMEHYLSEIERVLKRGGSCLITLFLANDESISLIDAGKSSLPFPYPMKHCRVNVPDTPEGAVCFDEPYIRKLWSRLGLDMDPVYYGDWCGRKKHLSYQDVVVATKTGAWLHRLGQVLKRPFTYQRQPGSQNDADNAAAIKNHIECKK